MERGVYVELFTCLQVKIELNPGAWGWMNQRLEDEMHDLSGMGMVKSGWVRKVYLMGGNQFNVKGYHSPFSLSLSWQFQMLQSSIPTNNFWTYPINNTLNWFTNSFVFCHSFISSQFNHSRREAEEKYTQYDEESKYDKN